MTSGEIDSEQRYLTRLYARVDALREEARTRSAAAQGVRRRRITTRGRTVVGLDDELLDAAAADGDQLVGEAALLAALDAGRTGRMRELDTPRMEASNVIDATGDWLAAAGWPDRTRYSLTTVDGERSRSVTLSAPPRNVGRMTTSHAATTDRLFAIQGGGVLVQPWTGAPGRKVAVSLPRQASAAQYHLVPVPGAMAVTTSDGTTVVGLA